MKLSQIDSNELDDNLVDTIVFSEIRESSENCTFGIVFGNYNLQNERIKKAVNLYHAGRIRKMLLVGGKNGISNEDNNNHTEAELMMNFALQNGVAKKDILIEEASNNTIENCRNISQGLLDENLKKLALITNDFHMKRCVAIFKKYFSDNCEYLLFPVKNGFSDFENWKYSERVWNSGRSLVEFEANALIKNATDGLIMDLEINMDRTR